MNEIKKIIKDTIDEFSLKTKLEITTLADFISEKQQMEEKQLNLRLKMKAVVGDYFLNNIDKIMAKKLMQALWDEGLLSTKENMDAMCKCMTKILSHQEKNEVMKNNINRVRG